MRTQTTTLLRRFGLLLVLLCAWSMPQLAGAAVLPIPTGPIDANGNPAVPDYYTTANWANSPPMAKFVDTLPTLGKVNNLGQYLSVGKPDVTSYPGSDYYEIELVQYREQMHSDLTAGTLLRGYRQVNLGSNLSSGTLPSQNLCGGDQHACTPADTAPGTGITPDPVHYLGPNLVSERDRPVRIKFTNRLPAGIDGNLFIPVDTTVMGAGSGPAAATGVRGQGTPCDNTIPGHSCASYTQNRADLHLHGGRTPWISDGTPHQWITPVEEITPFTKGVSLQNVPDMPDPGDGSSTYFYTNQQSARLMFYHDHAFGITRLGVYAGGAAGYIITDKYEQDLIGRGIIPADQIPLILQDKTFVDATLVTHPVTGQTVPKVRVTDPLWNWGSGPLDISGLVREPVTGDLWLPHVYMPAQTLAPGFGGVNPFGRWMYGPWFYPATVVEKGPVPNPYYDPRCASPIPSVFALCSTPGQPTKIPGTPNTSMGMEAFQDSAVVNGTVFPSLTVDPRAYRFRILNAASDRFWNLSFYLADTAQVSPDPRAVSPYTEVKTVPASASLALANNWPALWPVDGRDGGVPDPATKGPNFLQIGTEGGFLPQPVVIEPQPITYVTDPTAFWVGNVDKMGLALGPAERADVIVDFSAYAGQTLILYNDAPAAWPARVAGYDYYTGAPDLRDSGGYGTGGTYNTITGAYDGGSGPLVGYAPNTRTVMQVVVRAAGSTVDGPSTYNEANLLKEFTNQAPETGVNPLPVKTLFERAQEPIIVGQTAYSAAYPNSYFPPNFPWEGIAQINDQSLQFLTLAGEPVVAPTEPKGIHDEMGASFDPVYGRMSGNLGMQLPNPTTLNALLVLYGFSDIPTETIDNSTQLNVTVLPNGTDEWGTPINKLADGTQIWKISHNGVDTHPIHFHIFDVQLINRVGWDGQTLLPEPNELGWKDTVKISPLEDTIVAVRPRAPMLPFGITNSLRPLNPAIPLASPMGFNSVDWKTGQAVTPAVTNALYDFGWEYVWHCHILSHEEMDMMRPIVLKVVNDQPLAATLNVPASQLPMVLTWGDPTPVDYVSRAGFGDISGEIGFRIERADGLSANFAQIGTALANVTSFTDATAVQGNSYTYRVIAFNAAGFSNSNEVLASTVPPVSIVTAALADGMTGAAYNQTLTAAGAIAPYTWAISAGALPTPLTLNASTGDISGTPNTAGTFGFTVQVTAANGDTTTKPLSITIVPPVSITTTTLPGGTAGTAYSTTLAATGATTPYTWSIVGGALPAAVTLNAGTGVISGIPSAGGTYTFTARVTAANGSTNARTFSIVIGAGAPVPASNLRGAPASTTRITLTWTDNSNNETSFVVWRSANNGPFTPTTVTRTVAQRTSVGFNVTFNDNAVAVGGSYAYYVTAVGAAGTSVPTATITVDMLVPAVPTLTSVTAQRIGVTNNDTVTLTWTDVATETSYTVQRANNATFTSGSATTNGIAANSTTVQQTRPRFATYYYRVRAANAIGASGWSNVVSVVTP